MLCLLMIDTGDNVNFSGLQEIRWHVSRFDGTRQHRLSKCNKQMGK